LEKDKRIGDRGDVSPRKLAVHEAQALRLARKQLVLCAVGVANWRDAVAGWRVDVGGRAWRSSGSYSGDVGRV
jgi:hypothetical protein